MLSPIEIFYVTVGLLAIVITVGFNRHLFRRGGKGGPVSLIQCLYYIIALKALLIGWYFNLEYFREYGDAAGWLHWTKSLFVNPASASGGQDLIIANLVLLPLWTLIDGHRMGMRASWIYFPMSLLTSYAFGVALYLAIRERQLYCNAENAAS